VYKVKILLASIAIVFFLNSCEYARWEKGMLEKAEAVIEQDPAYALALLDSIYSPQAMNNASYNKYILLYTQAKDKNSKNIAADTLIYDAKDYFAEQKDFKRAALAAFYSGRIMQSQKNDEGATRAYLEAEEFAQGSDDNNLKGLIQHYIGELYYNQVFPDEAIERFKQAKVFFTKGGNNKNAVYSNNMIGNSFVWKQQYDSAFRYYQMGLDRADQIEEEISKIDILINVGVAFRRAKNFDSAKKYLNEALNIAIDKEAKSKIYYSLALVYSDENNKDSTIYYAKEAIGLLENEDNKDSQLLFIIYDLLTIAEQNNGNHEEALQHHKHYTSHVLQYLENRRKEAVYEIENKYRYEQVQNINNRLLIQRQWSGIAILALTLLVLLIIFLFYRNNNEKKKELLDAQLTISQLNDLSEKTIDKKDQSLRNFLYERFDLFKKVALLEGYLRDDEKEKGKKLLKKFNEIVYGQENLDWKLLYKTMNDMEDGVFDKISKTYPELDESEFRICALSYAGLSNAEIAIVLKFSVNTIQTKKYLIRKKLGIKEYGNMVEFFKEKFG